MTPRAGLLLASLLVACGGHVGGDASDASSGLSGDDAGAVSDGGGVGDAGSATDGAAASPDADDAVVVDTTDGAPALPRGCPDREPVNGQACGDGPYYCHYYRPGETCPTEFKCTSGGGPPYEFFGGDTNCKVMPPDACVDGADCMDVEVGASCVLECVRNCKCDPASRKLVCTAIAC